MKQNKKIKKIDNSLANLTRKMREITTINKIRAKKMGLTIDTNEIQRIMREYFEKLYSNKLENVQETDKFLDAFDLSTEPR
jgi:hypothetical protein